MTLPARPTSRPIAQLLTRRLSAAKVAPSLAAPDMQTQTPLVPPESFDNLISWMAGLCISGSLLCFLGVVRRQPVPEREARQ